MSKIIMQTPKDAECILKTFDTNIKLRNGEIVNPDGNLWSQTAVSFCDLCG